MVFSFSQPGTTILQFAIRGLGYFAQYLQTAVWPKDTLTGAFDMFVKTVLFLFLAISSSLLLAAEPSMGPIIEDYGPTFPIDDRDVPLNKDYTFRVVFDAGAYPGETDALNSELVSVARYLNMHGRNGVAPENMDIAVVLHGNALKGALTDTAYESRHDTKNPNRDLLHQLDAAGVKFYACGQSMNFRGYEKKELLSPVKVGLSAMTMLTVLQSDGYALLP
jgi:intracellular sulfur oxidation DsrE/DsrF family protein